MSDSDSNTNTQDCPAEPQEGEPAQLNQGQYTASSVNGLEICDGSDPVELEVQGSEGSQDEDSCDVELDSFLPIAKKLASALRHPFADVSYHFGGTPPPEEMAAFEAYVRRIKSFTLNASSFRDFSVGSILSLLMMRSWHGPFFQTLHTLRVDSCDSSAIQLLNFFLSPSLESVEIATDDSLDEAFRGDLYQFILSLSCRPPNLTCLKLRSTQAAPVVFPIPSKNTPGFDHICNLHLHEVVIGNWVTLAKIGALPALEDLNLVLPFGYCYTPRDPIAAGSDSWDVLSDFLVNSGANRSRFCRLRSLRVAARVEVLRDLLGYMEFSVLSVLSMTLRASSLGTPTLEMIRRQIEQLNMPDEDVISLVKRGEYHITFRNEDDFFCLLLDRAVEKFRHLLDVEIDYEYPENASPRRHTMEIATATKLLFHPHLQRLQISDWVTDFDLGQILDDYPSTHTSNLTSLHLPSNASSYETTGGASWTTLATVCEKFPNLTSFSAYFNRHISNIPDYTSAIPDAIRPNHSLQTLALGDGKGEWDAAEGSDLENWSKLGIFLYSLFPNLQNIIVADPVGEGDGGAGEWAHLKRIYAICQASARFASRG